MSFRQGHISVKREAARLEQSLTDDLSSVFHQTSRAMGLALHAAAEWFRPDPDELFDAAALEDDIARLLTAAKVRLDAAMAAKLGIDVLGYYDVRTVAHAVAMRYRDGASIALLEAWQAGESVEQAAERLAGLGKSSGELVARTSLNGMSNATSLAGAQFAGMRVKVWLTAGDDRVRPSHEAIDGEEIPLDAVFSNGCRFPGDPMGPGDETWNCRCTTIYDESSRVLRSSGMADTVEPMTIRDALAAAGDSRQDSAPPVLARWESPGIAFLDTLTSDGRALTGEIDWRQPPLPLMFQPDSAHGSIPTMQSRMVGGIDKLTTEGNAISASGSLDDTEAGAAAAAALSTGRFGVSIDLAVHDWEEVYNKDMFAGLEELFASASGSTSLSLGDRNESWDGGSSMQPDDFSKGYFWNDPAGDAATKAAYKLPFASRSGGTLHAVWNGVTAAAAAIQGARGGVSIPDGDVAGVKSKIEAYYTKAASTYSDDTITPPWASDSQTASASSDAGIAGEDDVVESYSIEDALFVVTKGTIMGATIAPFAAFSEARISLVSAAERIVQVSQPQIITLTYQPRGVSSDMLAAVAALEESVAHDRIPTLAAAVQAGVMTAAEARAQLGLPVDVPAPARGEETPDVARLLRSVEESAADRERALTTLTETVSKMQRNGGSVTFIRDEQGRITGAERSDA